MGLLTFSRQGRTEDGKGQKRNLRTKSSFKNEITGAKERV